MRTIEIKRKTINYDEYVRRSALASDYSFLIKEPTVIMENGVPVVIYDEIPSGLSTENMRRALMSLRYESSERTGGLKTFSRIFGYSPRVVHRKDFCSATSLAREFPSQHAQLCRFAEKVSGVYRTWNQTGYEKHLQATIKNVLPEYILSGSPFTSGIVNKNNILKYHFDSGNFKNVSSAMVVFKRDVSGGFLVLPEFDCALEVANNSLTIFDGQSILHGVSPIKEESPFHYRYSAVYYSLRQMWNCKPLSEELARIRDVKTSRERKRTGHLLDS